jgi:plasmid stabilization system protein ParE
LAYRLTRAAERQVDAVPLASARGWGIDAAGRYAELLVAAMSALGTIRYRPGRPRCRACPGSAPIRSG